ncbi:hypothetical protein KCU93_g372, partial [Aureobasidium melanogenum]
MNVNLFRKLWRGSHQLRPLSRISLGEYDLHGAITSRAVVVVVIIVVVFCFAFCVIVVVIVGGFMVRV